MFKKAVQPGRSKRKGEEVQTALRVSRSLLPWILANGKIPPVLPISEELLPYVEPERRENAAGGLCQQPAGRLFQHPARPTCRCNPPYPVLH